MSDDKSTNLPPRMKDITGKRFGHQVVTGFNEMRSKSPYWNVRCDCGNERPVFVGSLKSGKSTRCGHGCPANPYRKNELGNTYGKLTVIELSGGGERAIWICRCECGVTTTVSGYGLRSGKAKSCGSCWKTTHGLSRTPEYACWKSMKQRCYNPSNIKFEAYGLRGIRVCARWLESFENFFEDMGQMTFPRASIGRINNDGNYEPTNCRWETDEQQANNKRNSRYITYDGMTQTVSQWARRLGITHRTLSSRIAKGWPPEKIFSPEHYFTPPPVKKARPKP